MARPVRLHLSWRRNGDGLDVAFAVNRLLAHGRPVWWCLKPSGTAEPGDYLVEGPPSLAEHLTALGLSTDRWASRVPRGACPLETPRVSLLAGHASAYPYFAYYALCLTRLGLTYDPVGGGEIAGGALTGANLFILPGGFAIWGLDKSEAAPGADAALRAFLEGAVPASARAAGRTICPQVVPRGQGPPGRDPATPTSTSRVEPASSP